jgi:protein-disulfide isomerase
MIKLNRAQLKLLVLILFIIILSSVFFFMYYDRNTKVSNLEEQNIEDLKERNSENIIKAQSYKVSSIRAIDDSDIYVGNLDDNNLQVIVYEDYSNSFSAKYKESLDKLVSEYGDRVVLAFRPFSVSNNGLSSEANQAIYCAQDQNSYLDFREELLNRLNDSNLYKDDLYVVAKDLNLDTEQFSSCLQTNKYLGKLSSVSKEANDFGVFGAPTTFVGSELVIGARDWQDSIDSNGEQIQGLKTIIDNHLSN